MPWSTVPAPVNTATISFYPFSPQRGGAHLHAIIYPRRSLPTCSSCTTSSRASSECPFWASRCPKRGFLPPTCDPPRSTAGEWPPPEVIMRGSQGWGCRAGLTAHAFHWKGPLTTDAGDRLRAYLCSRCFLCLHRLLYMFVRGAGQRTAGHRTYHHQAARHEDSGAKIQSFIILDPQGATRKGRTGIHRRRYRRSVPSVGYPLPGLAAGASC